jgi:hypothetical protein
MFFHENNTKQHGFDTFRKPREGATIFISWETSSQKEGAYPKMEVDTNRLQKIADILPKSVIDCKV